MARVGAGPADPAFGEDAHPGAGEARGRFASGSDEQEEDREGFVVGELTVVDGLRAHPDHRVVSCCSMRVLDVRVHHRSDVHHRSAELVEAFVGHEAADRLDRGVPLFLIRGAASSGRPRILATMIMGSGSSQLAHPLDAPGGQGGVEGLVDEVTELGFHLLHDRGREPPGDDLALAGVVGRIGRGQHGTGATVRVDVAGSDPAKPGAPSAR